MCDREILREYLLKRYLPHISRKNISWRDICQRDPNRILVEEILARSIPSPLMLTQAKFISNRKQASSKKVPTSSDHKSLIGNDKIQILGFFRGAWGWHTKNWRVWDRYEELFHSHWPNGPCCQIECTWNRTQTLVEEEAADWIGANNHNYFVMNIYCAIIANVPFSY